MKSIIKVKYHIPEYLGETVMSEIIKTDCASCVHSCGLNVHLENGKIIKVEGMREHPLSKGYLCP